MATIIKTLGNTTFQYTLTDIITHKKKNKTFKPFTKSEDVERALRRQIQPKRVDCFVRNLY